VFNNIFPITKNPQEVIESIDERALVAMIGRRAATAILTMESGGAAQTIARDVKSGLSARGSGPSLFHFTHALMCNPAIRRRVPFGVDRRMATLIAVRALNVRQLLLWIYPRLLTVPGGMVVPLTREVIEGGNCWVFHMWDRVYVWFRKGKEGVGEGEGEGELGKEIQRIVNECWNWSGVFLGMEVLVEGRGEDDEIVNGLFVDDSDACGSNLKRWANIE
jgi:hypothetical protein